MSQFQAKDPLVLDRQLKVQELCVSSLTSEIQEADGANLVVHVEEPLDSVVCALFIDDSAGTVAPIPAASFAVCDSATPFANGGDRKAIYLAGVVLAANDVLIVKYIVK